MQLRNILVPIDFSKRGDRAMEQADLLANKKGAGLTVLHAVHLKLMERVLIGQRRVQLVEDTKRQLQGHTKVCQSVPIQTLVEMGNPSDVILDTAQVHGTDLIVIGDHGEFHIKEMLLGTTARHVIEHAHVPILVVKTPESKPYKRIFLATDFSDASNRAIDISLSLFDGATFLLYHGYPIPSNLTTNRYNLLAEEVSEVASQSKEMATKKLSRYLETLPDGFLVETIVRPSTSPSQDIWQAAQEAKADLIVVGTKGLGSFMPMMVGSVADALLRNAHIDMLIYKS